jgi:hypothetical protein
MCSSLSSQRQAVNWVLVHTHLYERMGHQRLDIEANTILNLEVQLSDTCRFLVVFSGVLFNEPKTNSFNVCQSFTNRLQSDAECMRIELLILAVAQTANE